jgi:hypothetical protein
MQSSAMGAICTLAADGDEPLSGGQLQALLGLPDLAGRPEEVVEAIVPEKVAPGSALRDMYLAYRKWKRGWYIHSGPLPGPDDWRQSSEFSRCDIWVYDESRHFARPYDCSLLSGHANFMAVMYFIEKGKVLGVRPLGLPRGTIKGPQQPPAR